MATVNLPLPTGWQNQIQYYMQGSVLSSDRDKLLHRLRGLCENAIMADVTFEDHEMVYLIKNNTNSVSFRVRRSLKHPDQLWHLRYLSNPEGGEKARAAAMRSCIQIAATDNVALFLEELGFQFDHELVIKGHAFKKGPMQITVSKLYKVQSRGDVTKLQGITNSHFVEVTLNTAVQQDALCDEMKSFAEHLKPIGDLRKAGHQKIKDIYPDTMLVADYQSCLESYASN